jgi:hypothetical protein
MIRTLLNNQLIFILVGAGKNLPLHHPVQTSSGATQPPIQRIPEAFYLEVKRPGRETDHTPPTVAEVKNAWSYKFAPPIRLDGVLLS